MTMLRDRVPHRPSSRPTAASAEPGSRMAGSAEPGSRTAASAEPGSRMAGSAEPGWRMVGSTEPSASPWPEVTGLTAREDQILELIGRGLTNREIGDRLGITEKTVKNTVTSVLAKLGMQRRTQAAAYVAVRGWRNGGPPAALRPAG